MSIALFAIIGAVIHAPVGYWIVFGFYCLYRVADAIYEVTKKAKEKQ